MDTILNKQHSERIKTLMFTCLNKILIFLPWCRNALGKDNHENKILNKKLSVCVRHL